MTQSVDTQPLSPAIPIIIQQAHEESDRDGRDRCYAWAQQHELPLIKADLVTAANIRDQHGTPNMTTFHGVTSE